MSLYLYCVTEHVDIFILSHGTYRYIYFESRNMSLYILCHGTGRYIRLSHGTCRYIYIESRNMPLYLYCVTEHVAIFILCHGTCHYIYIVSRNMSLYLYVHKCSSKQWHVSGMIIITVFKIKQILYNFRITSPPHSKRKIPGALLLLPLLLLKLFEPLTSLFLFLVPQLQILDLIFRTDHNSPKYMWLRRGEFPI
jgi:hypothetical protein